VQLPAREAAAERRIERRKAGGNRPRRGGRQRWRAPDLPVAQQLLEGV
jgi:hypothetical protein